MACPPYSNDAVEILEGKLIDLGKSLAELPSSIPELHHLLQKAEVILCCVGTPPPKSMADALPPIKKALIRDELLHHTDANIQLLYASCMNEISRITLPKAPYEDDTQMKKIFQLFIDALKRLSNVPSDPKNPDNIRARRILLAMSLLKTCLILLDLECNEMLIEMFQIFFNTIKPEHHFEVFKDMKTVMTLVIEEMDDIPLELVETLLSSIRLDKKEVSRPSWELGKTVLETCATRLQPHVMEAVNAKNLDPKDYAYIVSSLCQDADDENESVAGENVALVQLMTADLSIKDASRTQGISTKELMDGTVGARDVNQNTLEECCGGKSSRDEYNSQKHDKKDVADKRKLTQRMGGSSRKRATSSSKKIKK